MLACHMRRRILSCKKRGCLICPHVTPQKRKMLNARLQVVYLGEYFSVISCHAVCVCVCVCVSVCVCVCERERERESLLGTIHDGGSRAWRNARLVVYLGGYFGVISCHAM